mmetsp:Transcript_120802/g.341602  ORF Transcript_120802/g.341602 Transcript_120802/m.341602 type:complete len:290 (+) Transcript_120802:186-1055(+)
MEVQPVPKPPCGEAGVIGLPGGDLDALDHRLFRRAVAAEAASIRPRGGGAWWSALRPAFRWEGHGVLALGGGGQQDCGGLLPPHGREMWCPLRPHQGRGRAESQGSCPSVAVGAFLERFAAIRHRVRNAVVESMDGGHGVPPEEARRGARLRPGPLMGGTALPQSCHGVSEAGHASRDRADRRELLGHAPGTVQVRPRRSRVVQDLRQTRSHTAFSVPDDTAVHFEDGGHVHDAGKGEGDLDEALRRGFGLFRLPDGSQHELLPAPELARGPPLIREQRCRRVRGVVEV